MQYIDIYITDICNLLFTNGKGYVKIITIKDGRRETE